jgi:Predicted membrane protein (DUF2207) C-terminal domain
VTTTAAAEVVAGAAVAAWLAVVCVVYLLRRPSEPDAAPPTLELGSEPPAVAGLLVRDFRLDRETVAATLLDLAARGAVELEERQPGAYVARLRDGAPEPLTPYERQVLDLLRRRVRGGIVPTQALTTGPSDESKRWWRSFRREVIADAQARGLSRDLVDRPTVIVLTALAVLPAVAVGVAASSFEAGLACVGGALVGLTTVRSAMPQRDTPAGLAAASRWLGVRDRLGVDAELAQATPGSVALWERYLAYAAAFGMAPGVIAAIPMGAESDRRAWSAYGGRWRPVRVRYAGLLPLGWGLSPAGALLRAVLLAGGGVLALVVAAPVALDVADDTGGRAHSIVLALLVLPCLAIGIGAVLLFESLLDFATVDEVTGPILRMRSFGGDDDTRFYVAVDDGKSASVRAWRVDAAQYAALAQDKLVTASVTRHLRHARSIAPTSAA